MMPEQPYFDLSDDSDDEAGDAVLSFGKYKGQSIKELAAVRVSRLYLKYLISLPDLDVNVQAAINTALTEVAEPELLFEDAMAVTLPFGQHRGKSLGELAKTKSGRTYLVQLMKWDKLSEEMFQSIQVIMAAYNKFKTQ